MFERPMQGQTLKAIDVINGIIDGRLDAGRFADVTFAKKLNLTITRQQDSLRIDWDPKPEIDLIGPWDVNACYAEVGRETWKIVTPIGTLGGGYEG